MKKVNPQDLDLRTAMWECYDRRCFYSRRRIDFDVMELDHIVSQRDRSPEELRNLLKLLGRSEDFEIDSIYNLVPCHPSENKRKNADDDINGMILWLHKAKKMAPRIIAEINKLKTKTSINRNKVQMKSFILNGDEKAENIYDFLADDNQDFTEKREYYSNHYRYSKQSVFLNGTLPKYPNLSGYCSLVFRSLKIRDCIITLSDKEILSCFFKGLNTDPTLVLRNFIKAPFYNDLSQYWIQFGNATFPLTLPELQQLCTVVDDYAIEYLNSLKSIEKYLETENIDFTQNKKLRGGYRLLDIPSKLWDKMVEFALRHNYKNGTTKWHIFDSNRFKVKVCTRNNDKRYSPGYHAIFEPEKEINNYWSTDDVWIIWSPHLMIDKKERFNEMGYWNPKIALRWLKEEFIPHVYSQYPELQALKLRDYIGYECETFTNLNVIGSNEELLKLVNELQDFYLGYENIFLNASDYAGLLSALTECLNKIRLKNYNYIAGNLGYKNSATLEEILHDLQVKANASADQVLSSSLIDYYLRSLIELLSNNPLNKNQIDIKRIVAFLSPLFQYKHTWNIVTKYLEL